MKYETSYHHLTGQAKRDQAILDIQNYCLPKLFNTLSTIAMIETKYCQLSSCCAFIGITGYPVVALWNETRQTMRDMTT